MTGILEQNFKKRLQMVARERQSTPAVVWQNIIADRFLVRGANNSSMKDFHDLWSLLASSHKLTAKDTLSALKVFCEHRKTPLVVPLSFNEEDMRKLQGYWKRYLVSLSNKKDCPEEIGVIIEVINRWLH